MQEYVALGTMVSVVAAPAFIWAAPTAFSPAVWASLGYTGYVAASLVLTSSALAIVLALPRKLRPFGWGMSDDNTTFVSLPLVGAFVVWEMSLLSCSLKFYSDSLGLAQPATTPMVLPLIGAITPWWYWFFHGFTPIMSVATMGGGMGAVMLAFTFPAWVAGCSALGFLYASLASVGYPGVSVLISCLLKTGLVLLAPIQGYLGGWIEKHT